MKTETIHWSPLDPAVDIIAITPELRAQHIFQKRVRQWEQAAPAGVAKYMDVSRFLEANRPSTTNPVDAQAIWRLLTENGVIQPVNRMEDISRRKLRRDALYNLSAVLGASAVLDVVAPYVAQFRQEHQRLRFSYGDLDWNENVLPEARETLRSVHHPSAEAAAAALGNFPIGR